MDFVDLVGTARSAPPRFETEKGSVYLLDDTQTKWTTQTKSGFMLIYDLMSDKVFLWTASNKDSTDRSLLFVLGTRFKTKAERSYILAGFKPSTKKKGIVALRLPTDESAERFLKFMDALKPGLFYLSFFD